MARRNTPPKAARRYLDAFQRAMGCITHGTLFKALDTNYVVGEPNAILLNNGDPFLIRSAPDIYLSAGQTFRIVEEPSVPAGPYRVHTIKYFYQFKYEDREILAFHWTPEVPGQDQKRFPHLHVGPGLFSQPVTVLPDTFHKLHIPTGRVSFESIILFAIEELGVRAVRSDHNSVLSRGQHKFDEYRRKP